MVYQLLFIKIYSKKLQILTKNVKNCVIFEDPTLGKFISWTGSSILRRLWLWRWGGWFSSRWWLHCEMTYYPTLDPCSLSLEVSCIANMPLCTGVCLLPLSVPECTMPCMHCIASGAYDSSLQRHIRDAIQIKMSHGHSALIVRWMQLMTHCTDCKRSWCYLWRLVYPTIDTTRPRCMVKDFFPFPHRTIALVLPCHVPDIKHIISLVYLHREHLQNRELLHREHSSEARGFNFALQASFTTYDSADLF